MMLFEFDINGACIDMNPFAISRNIDYSPSTIVKFPGDDVKEETAIDDHMDIDDEGLIKIPSPIPIWPKPLALSYQNFLKYYTTLTYKNTERMEAGSRLVVSLLEFYFPRGGFKFWRLEYQPKTLIESVPVNGTVYWVVVLYDGDSSAKSTHLDDEPTLDVPPGEKIRAKHAITPEQGQLVLLVAIVTETKFLHLPERLTPSKLEFSSAVSTKNSAVVLDNTDGTGHRRGNVLVLGGTSKPKLLPSWEFYNFDVGRDGTSLIPWFGQLKSAPESLGTNILSLATSEAEKFDQMMRSLVSAASSDEALVPSISELTRIKQAQVAKREALKPQSQTVFNTTMTDNYLHILRVNKSGKLQGEGGRFLSKAQEKEARAVARVRGIRLQPCSYRVKTWKEKKEVRLAKEDRISMRASSQISMTPNIDIMDLETYAGGRDEGYGSA